MVFFLPEVFLFLMGFSKCTIVIFTKGSVQRQKIKYLWKTFLSNKHTFVIQIKNLTSLYKYEGGGGVMIYDMGEGGRDISNTRKPLSNTSDVYKWNYKSVNYTEINRFVYNSEVTAFALR